MVEVLPTTTCRFRLCKRSGCSLLEAMICCTSSWRCRLYITTNVVTDFTRTTICKHIPYYSLTVELNMFTTFIGFLLFKVG